VKPRTETARASNGERVAMLVRFVPVRLVEVSRGGCQLESPRRLDDGVSGQLAVELDGLVRVDDVRVARCQQRMGAGQVYQVGAELLRLRRLERRTIRMAIGTIISGERVAGHTRDFEEPPSSRKVRNSEVSGRTESRAPPVRLQDGP
jgi:hypothetical protein